MYYIAILCLLHEFYHLTPFIISLVESLWNEKTASLDD